MMYVQSLTQEKCYYITIIFPHAVEKVSVFALRLIFTHLIAADTSVCGNCLPVHIY